MQVREVVITDLHPSARFNVAAGIFQEEPSAALAIRISIRIAFLLMRSASLRLAR